MAYVLVSQGLHLRANVSTARWAPATKAHATPQGLYKTYISLSVRVSGDTTTTARWKHSDSTHPLGQRPTQPPPGWTRRSSHPRKPSRLHIVTRRRYSQSDTQVSLQVFEPCHTTFLLSSFRSNTTYWANLVEST